jgi:hypothetical protein
MNARGIVLVITLFALVLLLELATVGFMVSLEETRAGRNSVRMEHAREAAEAGIGEILTRARGPSLDSLQVGQTLPIPWTPLSPPLGPYRGSVRRLSDQLLLLRSEGVSRDQLARSEVALIARKKGPISGSAGVAGVVERSFILVF